MSLRHDGREWLAPSTPRDTSGAYGGGGGWDECIPTIASSTTPDGVHLRDHGEAWRLGWDVESVEVDSATLSAQVSPDLRMSRTITLDHEGVVQLRYRITTSERTSRVYWAAHPLFAAPPGATLTHAGVVDRWLPVGAVSPPDRGGIDEIPRGTAIKAFVAGSRMATLTRRDGKRLEIHWSEEVPWLGLYWDNSVFIPGAAVLAIEPTFARDDSAAVAWDDLPEVRSERPLDWTLRIVFP